MGLSNVAAYELATRVSRAGNDVHLISLRYRGATDRHDLYGVSLHSMESLSPIRSRATITTRIKFLDFARSNLQQIKPELVHVYSSPGVAMLPITISLRPKWVYDIQSVSVIGNPFIREAHNLITGLESTFYDKILIIDDRLKLAIPKISQAEEFPLGVNLDLFRRVRSAEVRTRLGLADDNITLVYSGSMHPSRHLNRLLEAFKIAQRAEPSLRFVMVGDSAASGLDKYSRDIGVQDKTIFTGLVPYEDVPSYLSSCDIGISYVPMARPYYAQPPLKTLESLACSLPTIATNTSGNRLIIREGENGILASDEPRPISDAILRLVRDSRLRENLSKSARKSIEGRDWTRIVNERLLPIYHELLKD